MEKRGILTLTDATNATLGPVTVYTLIIRDNDFPPSATRNWPLYE